ncbi:hypothetical protein N2605_25320 [Bradyrhizobium yuanmingense]|uniref:hypothetical protein n=1 Tax=Bradyrhizobium yuanmingense TaxID=108015 RepID=UPI0021A5B95D|nr:hypothetical protein [Bradyrhizobium sp. CB1024]UWU82892.1 hypothetical protein N2605_25320 [Bradyrhizobium sp. CB1024]
MATFALAGYLTIGKLGGQWREQLGLPYSARASCSPVDQRRNPSGISFSELLRVTRFGNLAGATAGSLLPGSSRWLAGRATANRQVRLRMSRVIRELEKYLGHTDAQLTAENIVDWKRAMVDAGLQAKTIQGSRLSRPREIVWIIVRCFMVQMGQFC